ncbi:MULTISPECIES: prepilin peptidase [unclassified Vibrio]|uniref:A24 family peptidase n=1 Tax=unclassified Vibrio TaxID=2614977 RepID=UPI00354C8D58
MLYISAFITLIFFSLIICFKDITEREIPNLYVVIIAIASFTLGFTTSDFSKILIVFVLGVVLISFWLANFIGGGDVKLILAFSLAIPANDMFVATILVILIGGVISVTYLLLHFCGKYGSNIWDGLSTLKPTNEGIPYGVAICSGFALVIFKNFVTGGFV